MSRNRVRNSQSLHWMGVVKWILIAGVVAFFGLCYMICKNQNLHLAQETYHLQQQLNSIEKRNSQLSNDLDTMKSPARLTRRLAQMHSSLVSLSSLGVMVVRMDQTVRSRLVRIGTMPNGSANYDIRPVAATVPVATPASTGN